MTSAAPKDRYFTVLGICTLLGIASLLPWNVLITQAEYLTVRAHQQPTNTWLADQIVSLTANSNLFMNLAAFLVLLPLGKHISMHTQIMEPLIMATAIVLVQAWLAYSTGVSGDAVIIVTLLSTALLGAATAPLTSATYSLASYLPPAYIQALVLGQSLAGVATSVLSFVTIWTSAASQHELPTPEDVQPAAVQYFVVCAAVVALGLVGYVTLPHMQFVQHWALRDESEFSVADNVSIHLITERSESNVQAVITDMVTKSRAIQTRRVFSRPSFQALQASGEEVTLSELTAKLRAYHWIVGLTFAVSLAGYPGIVASVCSVKNPATQSSCLSHPAAGRFYGDLFQPFLFLLFNVGDATGRLLAGFHGKPCPPAALFAYGFLRVLLVVGIAFCNIVTSKPWLLPTLLWSDFWPAVLVGLLGLTNGHLATITLMHAPRLVSQQERDRTGVVMSGSLTLGLAIGSFISFGLMLGLQHHDAVH